MEKQKDIKQLIAKRRIKSNELHSKLREPIDKEYLNHVSNMFKVLITKAEDTNMNFIFKKYDEHAEESVSISKDEFYGDGILDIRAGLVNTREVYYDRTEYWHGSPQYITAIIMEYKYDHKNQPYKNIINKLSDQYNDVNNKAYIPFEHFCIINRDIIQFIFPVDIYNNKNNLKQNLNTIEKVREGLDNLLATTINGTLTINDCHILIPGAIYNGYQAVVITQTQTEDKNSISEMYDKLCNKIINTKPIEPIELVEPLFLNNQPVQKRTAMGQVGQWRYYKERAINITEDIKFLVQYKKLSFEQQEKLLDMVTKMLLQIKHNAEIYPKCPKNILTDKDIKKIMIDIYKNIGAKLKNNVEKIDKDELKRIFKDNYNIPYYKEIKSGYRKPMYIYTSKKFLEILKPTEIESSYLIELLTDQELERRRQIRIKNNNKKICERSRQSRKANKDKRNEDFKIKYLELKEQNLTKVQIAKELKIGRQTLYDRLRRLGIE